MLRVLLVVENAIELLRASSALQLRGDVDVHDASTSDEARERVLAEDFDVLVIDGDMPPEGGFSLLYEIREQGQLRGEPTPPALIMAGRDQDRWLAGWAGADEVLVKPVDSFELAARVDGLVGTTSASSGARRLGPSIRAIEPADDATAV